MSDKTPFDELLEMLHSEDTVEVIDFDPVSVEAYREFLANSVRFGGCGILDHTPERCVSCEGAGFNPCCDGMCESEQYEMFRRSKYGRHLNWPAHPEKDHFADGGTWCGSRKRHKSHLWLSSHTDPVHYKCVGIDSNQQWAAVLAVKDVIKRENLIREVKGTEIMDFSAMLVGAVVTELTNRSEG